jgi:5'-nucleotidase / UDP-sugar diphosphatase
VKLLSVKSLLMAGLVGVFALTAVGCNKNKNTTPSSSALEITPDAAPVATYQPPATAIDTQPVIYDTAVTQAPTSSGTYTVQRGDTLYGIARKSYGDGKQWQKIASANPGVDPSRLPVGKTLVIP